MTPTQLKLQDRNAFCRPLSSQRWRTRSLVEGSYRLRRGYWRYPGLSPGKKNPSSLNGRRGFSHTSYYAQPLVSYRSQQTLPNRLKAIANETPVKAVIPPTPARTAGTHLCLAESRRPQHGMPNGLPQRRSRKLLLGIDHLPGSSPRRR